jgi:hypothetical protein
VIHQLALEMIIASRAELIAPPFDSTGVERIASVAKPALPYKHAATAFDFLSVSAARSSTSDANIETIRASRCRLVVVL